ncbi:MAG: RNA methyltransferase [Arenicella sp.]|nr:RNA methyltransferase [Arenicella sp.]
MPLNKIRIVLVEPTHPGNIGAVARAVKTMGLQRLVLVNPKKFPHYEASKRAAGAESVLQTAVLTDDIQSAIADCTLVLGTSVRDREVSWPTLTPNQAAADVMGHLRQNTVHQVAILFGRESSGLTNGELALCQQQISIPANPQYSSLNLAAAVQIVCYELRMAAHAESEQADGQKRSLSTAELRRAAATKQQLEGHLQHLQQTLESLDFIKSKPPTMLMRKLTRLYNKAQLTVEEVQILRGILTAIQDRETRS